MLPAVPGAKLSIFEKDVRPIKTFFWKVFYANFKQKVHHSQVGFLAMTTNERMNAARYPRFHTGTKIHFLQCGKKLFGKC